MPRLSPAPAELIALLSLGVGAGVGFLRPLGLLIFEAEGLGSRLRRPNGSCTTCSCPQLQCRSSQLNEAWRLARCQPGYELLATCERQQYRQTYASTPPSCRPYTGQPRRARMSSCVGSSSGCGSRSRRWTSGCITRRSGHQRLTCWLIARNEPARRRIAHRSQPPRRRVVAMAAASVDARRVPRRRAGPRRRRAARRAIEVPRRHPTPIT